MIKFFSFIIGSGFSFIVLFYVFFAENISEVNVSRLEKEPTEQNEETDMYIHSDDKKISNEQGTPHKESESKEAPKPENNVSKTEKEPIDCESKDCTTEYPVHTEPETQETIQYASESPTEIYSDQTFWHPFDRKSSAHGFSSYLRNLTNIDIKVIEQEGAYIASFKYTNEEERRQIIDLIENKSGLKLGL